MLPGSYSISVQTSYYKNSTTKNDFNNKNLTKTCGQENVRSGKCPFGEMSVGEVSVGKVSVGELSSGKYQSGTFRSGNCPHTASCLTLDVGEGKV